MSDRTFSVVVCTLNRADSLAELFPALRAQTHSRFEVVVVPGPCDDHTEAVLDEWRDHIKVVRNPERNLSRSRNLGIGESAGEVVAFIDDDGIPEPTWLDELDAAYDDDDDEVAGVGGVVRDHTGYGYQCRFNCGDRFGSSDPTAEVPLDDLCLPGTMHFPYLIGTNSSFRRDRLLEVGGFDEEYEFYLDETDVCLRLIDAGYVLRQLPGAEVLHKFLPSGVRNPERVTWDLFAVMKNKVYFSLVNREPGTAIDETMESNAQFAMYLREGIREHADAERITAEQLEYGLDSIERGWPAGLTAGLRGRQSMYEGTDTTPTFRPFPTTARPDCRLHVAFVTQSLPPDDIGGIGRYMLDAARGLARRGHWVHIITTAQRHNTVDLEEGVWVHRIRKDLPQEPSAMFDDVPERIWRNAGAVSDEVDRVHSRQPLDAVLGSMWDVEALAVLERLDVPVVTTLVTTLGLTLPTKAEWAADPAFMAEFVNPMLKLERELIERSEVVHAISESVADAAVATAQARLDRSEIVVAPLGIPDLASGTDEKTRRSHSRNETGTTVLFVGRLEMRKGIDLLLDAAPVILQANPAAEIVIIGRDDIPGPSGATFRQEFTEANSDQEWFHRVHFRGVVSDEELLEAYRDCGIFVAPSRYESFGLIFVEAMRAAKPVVALKKGAAPEMVLEGETGVLVEEGPDQLAETINALLLDPERARTMGKQGRRRFESDFGVEAMVERFEAFLAEMA